MPVLQKAPIFDNHESVGGYNNEKHPIALNEINSLLPVFGNLEHAMKSLWEDKANW